MYKYNEVFLIHNNLTRFELLNFFLDGQGDIFRHFGLALYKCLVLPIVKYLHNVEMMNISEYKEG